MICFAKKNTNVKCMGKINTQKTTYGTLVPFCSSFWVQFRFGAFKHHKHNYVQTVVWVGMCKSMLLLGHKSQMYVFNMVLALFRKRYHLSNKLGFCLTINTRTTFRIYLKVNLPLQAIAKFFQHAHKM